MSSLYFLIPLALILFVVIVSGLLWAIRSGQFDDLEGPAHRILMDDDDPRIPHNIPHQAKKDVSLTDASLQDKDD